MKEISIESEKSEKNEHDSPAIDFAEVYNESIAATPVLQSAAESQADKFRPGSLSSSPSESLFLRTMTENVDKSKQTKETSVEEASVKTSAKETSEPAAIKIKPGNLALANDLHADINISKGRRSYSPNAAEFTVAHLQINHADVAHKLSNVDMIVPVKVPVEQYPPSNGQVLISTQEDFGKHKFDFNPGTVRPNSLPINIQSLDVLPPVNHTAEPIPGNGPAHIRIIPRPEPAPDAPAPKPGTSIEPVGKTADVNPNPGQDQPAQPPAPNTGIEGRPGDATVTAPPRPSDSYVPAQVDNHQHADPVQPFPAGSLQQTLPLKGSIFDRPETPRSSIYLASAEKPSISFSASTTKSAELKVRENQIAWIGSQTGSNAQNWIKESQKQANAESPAKNAKAEVKSQESAKNSKFAAAPKESSVAQTAQKNFVQIVRNFSGTFLQANQPEQNFSRITSKMTEAAESLDRSSKFSAADATKLNRAVQLKFEAPSSKEKTSTISKIPLELQSSAQTKIQAKLESSFLRKSELKQGELKQGELKQGQAQAAKQLESRDQSRPVVSANKAMQLEVPGTLSPERAGELSLTGRNKVHAAIINKAPETEAAGKTKASVLASPLGQAKQEQDGLNIKAGAKAAILSTEKSGAPVQKDLQIKSAALASLPEHSERRPAATVAVQAEIKATPELNSKASEKLKTAEEEKEKSKKDRSALSPVLLLAFAMCISGLRKQQVNESEKETELAKAQESEGDNDQGKLRRRTHLVEVSDTLQSIAEKYFSDCRVAWLIADLNKWQTDEHYLDQKRVIELKARQIIELPEHSEVNTFLFNLERGFDIDQKLLSFTSDTMVNLEVLKALLGPLMDGGRGARNSTVNRIQELPELTIHGADCA